MKPSIGPLRLFFLVAPHEIRRRPIWFRIDSVSLGAEDARRGRDGEPGLVIRRGRLFVTSLVKFDASKVWRGEYFGKFVTGGNVLCAVD